MDTTTSLFTPEWMKTWQHAISADDAYRTHGQSWREPLLLKFTDGDGLLPEPHAIGFRLDLQGGSCKEIRYAFSGDEASVATIMSASFAIWKDLIESGRDPLFLVMKGSITLEKGSLFKLSGQRKAAKALLEAASKAAKKAEQVLPENPDVPAKSDVPYHPEKKNGRARFSTPSGGLDPESFPMKLFQKAKQLGIWNPSDIDFSKDRKQWESFTDTERTVLLHLTSMFVAGEEAVTLDLLPLIMTVAEEGRIEEEIYLTSFLWEEAKHTEFFDRFLKETVRSPVDMESFHGPAWRRLFHDELHTALNRLRSDSGPENQLRASVTYNLIVEGTLAETGYEAYYNMLSEQDMLPGLREGIGHLKRDESRHIAFGLYFIRRLIEAHPHLTNVVEEEAGRLLHQAIDVVNEIFAPYPEMPFGLDREWYITFASGQFSKRLNKLME